MSFQLDKTLCLVVLWCITAECAKPLAAVAEAGSPPGRRSPRHTVPALYTQKQADSGASAYQLNCARCHGPLLDGQVGGYSAPALRGPEFGDPDLGLHVNDVFRVIARRMPASAPGSLAPRLQVDVLAFLLNQNGFPPGSVELTYQAAWNSVVPFVFHSL